MGQHGGIAVIERAFRTIKDDQWKKAALDRAGAGPKKQNTLKELRSRVARALTVATRTQLIATRIANC